MLCCVGVIGVPIAAGVLYPVFGLLLSPTIAAAAITFSSGSAAGNALRLHRVRLLRGQAGSNHRIAIVL